MTAHEQQRLAASHEYRLLDAPADDVARPGAGARGGTTVFLILPGS